MKREWEGGRQEEREEEGKGGREGRKKGMEGEREEQTNKGRKGERKGGKEERESKRKKSIPCTWCLTHSRCSVNICE
jgi:hypothetical protein